MSSPPHPCFQTFPPWYAVTGRHGVSKLTPCAGTWGGLALLSFQIVGHHDFGSLFPWSDIYLQMLCHRFSLLDKKLMFFSEV